MLKAALFVLMGLLITLQAETNSYLDTVDPTNDLYSSTGWHDTYPSYLLIDGNFAGDYFAHNYFAGYTSNNLNHIRVDLGSQV